MRRLGLANVLIAVNVGLVCVAVGATAWVAARRLERLGEQQGLARASLAATNAALAIRALADEAADAGRSLAESATLGRYVANGDVRDARAWLERFQTTSRVSAAVVLRDGMPFARTGVDGPWTGLAPGATGAQRFVVAAPEGRGLLSGAAFPLPFRPGATVLVAVRLDDATSREVGQHVGTTTRIVERDAALGVGLDDPRAPLRARVAHAGVLAASRLVGEEAWVAVAPIQDPSGRVAGFVETALPFAEIAVPLRRFLRSLLAAAVVVAAIGALLSILVGRSLAAPLARLTEASVRIGAGDLATPIPRARGAEIGTLAAAMDDMRGRLLDLTGALKRREAEARAVLTGIAEGVFSVDRQRRITWLNPQAAGQLGVAPEQAIGRFCGDVLRPEGPSGTRPCEENCPILDARFRGSARATEHLRLTDGSRRTVVVTSAAPAEGDDEEGGRQFQVLRDESEDEAARRLRDAILANISHEFRTPLAAQIASIELLRDRIGETDAAGAAQLVRSLERGALRLVQLIDNLLESVRIEAGELSLRRGPVALDDVVEQAAELTRPLFEQRGQELVVELPYPFPEVHGDAPRLVQVLVNLLANANKFAPSGSKVRVGGSAGRDEIAVWVEDEGPGLPEGAGVSPFDRFVRSSRAGAEGEPEPGGVGLGLWIVKSIVERHGGRVEAFAAGEPGEEPGRGGTRVTVTLPAERAT